MSNKTAIAWRNLVHDRARTGLALAGIGFALVVIFMQLGFRQAVQRTATVVLGKLDFDLIIVSKNYLYLADPGTFPMDRIRTAASVEGVASVVPVYVRLGLWRSLSPERPPAEGQGWVRQAKETAAVETWKQRSILMLGSYRFPSIFAGGVPGLTERESARVLSELSRPGALMIDRLTRAEFGPQQEQTPVELNGREFQIVGNFEMGTGFASDGAALVNHHNFAQAFGGDALNFPTLGLVKVANRRRSREILERLRAELPVSDRADGAGTDVRVLARDEIIRAETLFWISDRSIGILFSMGVVISFIVGFVVFHQVFSSDVADHLPEYATLKAIGYSDGQVRAIVASQAMLLGLIGYAGALAVSVCLYRLVAAVTRTPMSVWDGWILALPLLMGLVISGGSAVFSIRKINAANPADLFQ
jgi:putative ABC transport system permease protein